MEYHIKTNNLGKTYKSTFGGNLNPALKSLSLEVPAGTVMGFLGKNGAGKTTTIKILLGLISPTEGEAWLMGKDIKEADARTCVSYMPEIPALDLRDSAVTFFQVIGQICHLEPKLIKERLEKVMVEVGLEGKENVLFAEYSRGMKQRFELAQALFSQPKLLILDEPFSGLDPIGRINIRDLIMRYNKELGTTVFFSSHILADVEILCDSIGILDHGELKTVGDKRELLGVEYIAVSGDNVDSKGIMFLEKMSDHIDRRENSLTLFLTPGQDVEKIKALFEKYGADNIQVDEHCKSLEKFFGETVGQ